MHTHAPVAPLGCALCQLRGRRTFTALLGLGLVAPAGAQQQQQPEGVKDAVGKTSKFARFVPADWLESQAGAQYAQMMRAAAQKQQLAGAQDRQLQRLRHLAQRIVPFAPPWNPRAPQWQWEVNLLNEPVLNAFCMPGGKIAFYRGILAQLQLSDDEVAAIMGHEVAHALREHARERMGKTVATRTGLGLAADVFGLGGLARGALNVGAELAVLKFSRDDETEADLVGMELAARAGYNPAAGVTLWQKMMNAAKGAPPQFLSTHPAGTTRIKDIQGKLPRVQPLYQRAPRPDKTFGPPAA
jgi:predicted Zn-dependent protease